MKPCKITIRYAKSDNPDNGLFSEPINLHLKRTEGSTRVWSGSAASGTHIITITQKHPSAEISEGDVMIQPVNPNESDYFIATSNSEIAEGFNKYINNLYQ